MDTAGPPPEVCTLPVPNTVPVFVSVNVTIPVGDVFWAEVYFNCAVNVTVCPTVEGLEDEIRLVTVGVN